MTPVVITKVFFQTVCPLFTTLTDAEFDAFLPVAQNFVDADVFGSGSTPGDMGPTALCYVMAHLLSIGKFGANGPTIMEKVGDLQAQYATRKMEDTWDMTGYGVTYKMIRRMRAPGISTSGGVVLSGVPFSQPQSVE